KQETVDFFADRWTQTLQEGVDKPIGQYLQSAGLLNEAQIKTILEEQQHSGLQFGVLAAYKGWVNSGTIDFFLANLKSQAQKISVPLYDRQSPQADQQQTSGHESLRANDWIDRLAKANLLSPAQLQILEGDRALYPDMSIEEILTLRGWIRPKTLEFFQYNWVKLSPDHPIGYYLQEADLLTDQQVQELLRDQWQTGVKIGALAVMRGWLNQETINVFLQTLSPEKLADSPFISKPEVSPDHTAAADSAEEETEELLILETEKAYESLDEFADAYHLSPDSGNDQEIKWIT
ncbi:MAG: hypothetical protein ACO3NK_08550, partial [Prochlorotrichaceae cyanobacterium]